MHAVDPPETSGRGLLLGFYLYLVVALALPSQWLFWDDIGFLLSAREGGLDYGHLLYLPALRAAQWLARPLFASEEYAAKLFSMVGGALAFTLLWARLERRGGLRRPLGLVIALLVTATPLFWRQLSVIEPTTWTLVGLLASASAAEAYGRERGVRRLATLTLAFGATLGLHLASVCALPWILWLARGPAPPPRARELAVPLVLVALALGLGELAGDPLARIGAFWGYWKAFLPRAGEPGHLVALRQVLVSGVPMLALAALAALAALLGGAGRGARGERRAGELVSPALLALPYLVAFLAFGKPVVGLLMPCTLALGLFVAAVARRAQALAPRVAYVLLSTLLACQAFVSSAFALHHATTPDEGREAAVLYAGALPKDALLVAGPLAQHVRWHTDAPVLPLPNLLHAARARGAQQRTPLELLQAECQDQLERYAAVYLTSDAVAYLVDLWGVAPAELPADDARTIVVRAHPPLALVLFAGRREER